MWQLGEEETKIESQLFAPLYLSYLDLSPTEKLCLSYCVWFRKDHSVPKDILIKMWMAQGYLKETNTKDMEMVGEESFRNLSSRSFFHNFTREVDGKITEFTIHDIVRDFIHFISNKECLSSEQFKDETVKDLGESLRHLLFQPSSKDKFINSIYSFKKLRSLNVSFCGGLDLRKLFNELTCLRSLVMSWCDIKEIPSEIGKLIHLRLLDISQNHDLSDLPETINDLCNLMLLNTFACYNLKEYCLRGIEKLSNLRYFILGYGLDLTQEIGRLQALREAMFFVESETCSLANLNNMNNLSCVDLFLGRQVEHVDGAKLAHLNKKKRLVKLIVFLKSEEERRGTLEDEENRWKIHDEEFIEALQPCSNLEKLYILGYMGANPNPSWFVSLQHLRMLKLSSWRSNTLPTLGKLTSLIHLELSGFTKVKNVGVEFLGIDETLSYDWAFPKLKWLEFYNFETWEEWEMKDWSNFSILPCLTSLTLEHCSKLKAVPHHLLQNTTLKQLYIRESSLLQERYKDQEIVDWIKINHSPRGYAYDRLHM